jgi:hypothetical protein
MNISAKISLTIIVTVFALFQYSMSNGQVAKSDLKGKWVGSGSLLATPNGFSSSKDVITINIYQQEDFKFKGSIERNHRGKFFTQEIRGYVDRNRRNVCLVDQNKNIIIGYVLSNTIMKLYCSDNYESNEITLYTLRKAESESG